MRTRVRQRQGCGFNDFNELRCNGVRKEAVLAQSSRSEVEATPIELL